MRSKTTTKRGYEYCETRDDNQTWVIIIVQVKRASIASRVVSATASRIMRKALHIMQVRKYISCKCSIPNHAGIALHVMQVRVFEIIQVRHLLS